MPHKRAKKSTRDADKLEKGSNNPPPKPSSDSHFNSLPKGAMRILNAAKIQAEYNAKKKARKEAENGILPPGQEADNHNASGRDRGKGKQKAQLKKAQDAKDQLKIRPGEKVGDFNRRIDRLMAPEINAAMRSESKSSEKLKRKKRKADQLEEGDGSDSEENSETLRKQRAEKASNIKASEPTSQDLRKAREGLQTSGGEDRDWIKASQRRSVNDIAMAPPNLTKAPRGEGKTSLIRKARLKAAMEGEDMDKAEELEGLKKNKVRLPDPIKKNENGNGNGKEKVKNSSPSLSRQNLLAEERERAIKAYRVRKEEGIKEREEIKRNKR